METVFYGFQAPDSIVDLLTAVRYLTPVLTLKLTDKVPEQVTDVARDHVETKIVSSNSNYLVS